MTTIDQMHQWCVEARNMLGTLDKFNTKDLKVNSEAVLALLTTMQNDPLKATRYPQLANFEADYETYSNAARQQPKKKVLERVTSDLKNLQQRLKSAIGNADPKASPEIKKQVLAEARHKPVYDNKCKRIQAAIDELTPLPGTGPHVLKLEALLAAGARQIPDYEKAYKALQGLTDARKQGREAAQKWGSGEFDSELKKALAALRLAIDQHQQLAGMGDAEHLQKQQAWINQSLVTLAGSSGDTKKVDKQKLATLVQAAGQRTTTLQLRTTGLKKTQKDVEDLHKLLRPVLEELQRCAPLDVIAGHQQLFDNAESLAGSQKYGDALDTFTKLSEPLKKAKELAATAYEKWKALDVVLEDYILLHKEISISKRTPPPEIVTAVSSGAALLRGELRTVLAQAHRYDDAVQRVEKDELVADLKMLRQQFKNTVEGKEVVMDFTAARPQLDLRLKGLGAPVRDARQSVDQAIQALQDLGGHGDTHLGELKTLMEEWNDAIRPYQDPAGDAKAMLTTVDTLGEVAKRVEANLKTLLKTVENQSGNPEQLKTSQGQQEQAEALKSFEAAQRKAKAALGYLDDLGAPGDDPVMGKLPSLADLRHNLSELAKDAKDNQRLGTEQMLEIESEAKAKRQEYEAALVQRRQANLKKVQELRQQITALHDKTPKAYRPYLERLQDELSGTAGLIGSNVVALLAEGENELKLFESRFLSYQAANRNEDEASFARVDKELKRLKDLLASKDFKTYQPNLQKQLQTQLEDVIPAELPGLSPREALKKLDDHDRKIHELSESVKKLQTRHQELLTQAAQRRMELENLKVDAPALYAELDRRIAQVENIKAADTAEGEVMLKSAALLVISARNPDKRNKLDAKASTDALEAGKAEGAFKAALDVFKKDTQRSADSAKSEAGSDHDGTAYDLIALRLKDAETAGDQKNYADAMDKLRLAHAAAKLFIDNPYKPTVAAGRALVSASANWKTAVGNFLGQLRELNAEILRQLEADSPSEGAGKAKATENALKPLETLFNPVAFEAAAVTLRKLPSGKGSSPERAQHRAEKEKILVTVNRYLRLVEENKLLATAADNPFSPVTTTEMKRALSSLRAAFLAA